MRGDILDFAVIRKHSREIFELIANKFIEADIKITKFQIFSAKMIGCKQDFITLLKKNIKLLLFSTNLFNLYYFYSTTILHTNLAIKASM